MRSKGFKGFVTQQSQAKVDACKPDLLTLLKTSWGSEKAIDKVLSSWPHSIYNKDKNIRVGLLDYWTIGLLDYWTIGLLDYWTIGLLDYWTIGVQKYSCA